MRAESNIRSSSVVVSHNSKRNFNLSNIIATSHHITSHHNTTKRIIMIWFSKSFAHLLFGGVLATLWQAKLAEASTCLLIYQMADNDLEPYLKKDFEELAQSRVIRSDDLRAWVYFDARNSGGEPPQGLFDEDGSLTTASFTGSRYMSFDKTLGGMRVMRTLSGEQNSDSLEVIQAFLEFGITDCLAGGFSSFMAVFSSHGGGFGGFGGDDNIRLRGLAMQYNHIIAEAIQGALSNTPGAPDKLDVLGFDACNMMAMGAADDYMKVSKYFMGSEAVEPGHGWAYDPLSQGSSALALAQEAASLFVSEKQGNSHRTPKAIAIIDMDLFQVFVTAFEELFELLLGGIQEDATLHAFVGRARSSSVSFEAVMDATGTTDPSGLDIGSFLSNLDTLCQPGGAIGTALASAIEAYNAMIVENHIGPGTAAGTGMHVTWPTQNEYALQPDVWNTVLFQREVFMTAIVPNYRAFLEYFLTASLPNLDSPTIEAVARNAGGETVCFTSAIPSGEPDEPDGMLYGTDVEVLPDLVTVSAGIGRSVSYLLYEYGVDLTTPLKGLLLEKGYRPEDGDTLYLYGGDVQGNYRGSEFSAEWNRQMYFLNISGVEAFEALYVVDQGDGSKNVPVLYFPEEYRQDVGRLQFLDYLFFNFEYWVSLGAKYGFLKFSVDPDTGAIDDNLILFTSVSDTKGFKEEPRSSKGLMIPLVYVEGNIQGRKINSIPGGFNQTLINWSDHIDYNIISVKDETILDVIPETDAVQVTLKAYDFTTGGMLKPEVRSFDVVRINDGGGDLWKDKKEEEQAMGEDLLSYGSSAGRLGMESVVAFATALLVLFSR